MNRNFFEKYVSSTPTGTSHNNLLLEEKPIRETYRAWFRVAVPGSFRWRFYFTNTVNSTMNDGEVAYPDRPGGNWKILSARVGACPAPDTEWEQPAEVLFDGEKEKAVAPDETFWSDEVALSVKEGGYLLWEWTIEGNGIPFTGDSMVTAKRLTADGWISDDRCPKPDLLGCDRKVKKRIAFLGDSITEGCETPVDACDHWAGRLAFRLGEDYAVWNIGLGFARASDAAYHKSWMKKAMEYDAVNVSFGVNDINSGACGKHLAGDSADEVLASLEAIVKPLREAGKQVILFGVPAFDFDYDAQKLATWETVNAHIPLLADKYGCAYYDFAAVTDCPGHHGHGRYQPHPTGYGCWLIEQDLWEKLGEVYRA